MVNLLLIKLMQNNEWLKQMFNRSYCIYLMNTLLGDVYVPRGYTTALPENYAYNRETSESLYN